VTNGQRVLVVDGPPETEEVLKAVLEPQGLEINRIRTHLPQSLHDAKPPHLVILHEEAAENSSPLAKAWPGVPRLIIGSVALADREPQCPTESSPREERLCLPFHYRDLIQAVETLLANS
jgi:hypothetical protein